MRRPPSLPDPVVRKALVSGAVAAKKKPLPRLEARTGAKRVNRRMTTGGPIGPVALFPEAQRRDLAATLQAV